MARTKGSKNKGTGRRFKPWEGQFPDDKHIRLTKNMMMDERFISLSGNAVRLYLYMKLWAVGHDDVEYAASMADQFMSKPTYIKARQELIEAGFVDYLNSHCAKDKRETAKFQFTDRWQWQHKKPAEIIKINDRPDLVEARKREYK